MDALLPAAAPDPVPADPIPADPIPADRIPDVSDRVVPPLVRGAAAIAHRAFAGAPLAALQAFIDRPAATLAETAALALDMALAQELTFHPEAARALQFQALAQCQLYRVENPGQSAAPLRVLALVAPGDLMVNTPLDFITAHLDIRLDLLYLRPGHPLPQEVPEHDVAFFAVSESDPVCLLRLMALHAHWPRPAINDPARVIGLSRDGVARLIGGVPAVLAPPIRRLARASLHAPQPALDGLDAAAPLLIRPLGAHAGHGLARLDDATGLAAYLRDSQASQFYVSQFAEYRGTDGLYRKYRIAFFDGAPFLCHMAVSEHWMIHYLNAGMAHSAEKRAQEAHAMATFEEGFARRHAAAFAAIHARLSLDCWSMDCGEMPDGRLIVFEVDVAAIIHMMDPPALYPYKPAAMRRAFAGFEAMLRRRITA
ncbi:MAG: hypothetical protein KGJ41_10665 [Rhodospirillales bacterium]|nr:hypothetical protein [Rhodospirillales bacterium]